MAGAAEARSGRQRRPHPGGRIARRRSRRSSATIPAIWLPDNLFLLQEYLPHDPERASSGWSFSAASCSMRCGSRRTAASISARRRSATLTTATACARCRTTVADGAAGGVLSVSRTCRATRSRRRQRIVDAAAARRRRHRVSRDRRRPPRVLRHQRQLEPAALGGGGIRLRPFERVVDFLERHIATRHELPATAR